MDATLINKYTELTCTQVCQLREKLDEEDYGIKNTCRGDFRSKISKNPKQIKLKKDFLTHYIKTTEDINPQCNVLATIKRF